MHKPDDLSSVPLNHGKRGRENQLTKVSSDPYIHSVACVLERVYCSMHVSILTYPPTHTHTYAIIINKYNMRKIPWLSEM